MQGPHCRPLALFTVQVRPCIQATRARSKGNARGQAGADGGILPTQEERRVVASAKVRTHRGVSTPLAAPIQTPRWPPLVCCTTPSAQVQSLEGARSGAQMFGMTEARPRAAAGRKLLLCLHPSVSHDSRPSFASVCLLAGALASGRSAVQIHLPPHPLPDGRVDDLVPPRRPRAHLHRARCSLLLAAPPPFCLLSSSLSLPYAQAGPAPHEGMARRRRHGRTWRW